MLYNNNYPYYPNRNKGIELFVVSIITTVTGIYDSRWRVFSWPNYKNCKFMGVFVSLFHGFRNCFMGLLPESFFSNITIFF